MKNHWKLLLGLGLGILAGTFAHQFQDTEWLQFANQNLIYPVGQIFLRLLFMIVVPMVFSALVLGVYDLASNQGVGKVASMTLFYTVIASTASVIIGIGLVNTFRPGEGFNVDRSIFENARSSV